MNWPQNSETIAFHIKIKTVKVAARGFIGFSSCRYLNCLRTVEV